MFSFIILETRKRLSILATHMDKLLTFSQELEKDCGEELGKYFYRANIQNIFYCDHSKKCPYLRRTAGAVWDRLK